MFQVIQVIVILLGMALCTLTVQEPTYEELLRPVPFFGMCMVIVGILLGFIVNGVKWLWKKLIG
jgi:uncharacterized membrane protein YwzB